MKPAALDQHGDGKQKHSLAVAFDKPCFRLFAVALENDRGGMGLGLGSADHLAAPDIDLEGA